MHDVEPGHPLADWLLENHQVARWLPHFLQRWAIRNRTKRRPVRG